MEGEDRPVSPYLITCNLDQSKYITSREKVPRIRCPVGYHAEVVKVDSPNEIWIRCLNHIADTLVLPLRDPPPLEFQIRSNSYVMAPMNGNKLARARVLTYDPLSQEAMVRFIDHGKITKISGNHLYEMSDQFRSHPWQTILVSLHNVNPDNEETWSTHEVQALRDVLSRFPYVWVIPQLTRQVVNNDSEPNRVLLNGLSEEDFGTIMNTQRSNYDDLGESVIILYNLEVSTNALTPNPIIDCMDCNIYPIDLN